MYAVVVF